ncbi:hypothetical protein SAMN04487995_4597 [Dyadobacter koreensis]|uniref:Uncharacterized protein n=1 Tax=Dyadobacter koreensis TaxID=408657 RepID=A0A1H6YX70_9BACT|nr:hypothetical protein [Dyadobacter koreensis]SEJ41860.1 hypothetical protein SAMN04487995_4597 [Dyadobacter koreensis]
MDKIDKEIQTKIKGHFSAKYGILMDDWSSMVLNEIVQNFLVFNEKVENATKKLEEASTIIKGKVHQINFRTHQEAFKFGLGISAPVSAMGSLVAILVFCYKTNTDEYLTVKRIAQSYENVSSYKILMEHGEIVRREGQYFLTLSLANKGAGDMLIGKEYVFDGRTKRILIPLGRN